MTLPLTDSEIDLARLRSDLNRPHGGTREVPQPYEDKSDDLAPARGIMIGMLIGSVLWVVVGIVIYFKFFN